jgi:hypothetical protein
MGRGVESVIIWGTRSPVLKFLTHSLHGSEKLSEVLISDIKKIFEKSGETSRRPYRAPNLLLGDRWRVECLTRVYFRYPFISTYFGIWFQSLR